jgi:hypothetical protein
MEYFEESFIFDRSSNNNVLRMQTQHADPNVRMSRLETEAELKSVSVGFKLILYNTHRV